MIFHPLDLPLHPLGNTQIGCNNQYLPYSILTLQSGIKKLVQDCRRFNLTDSKAKNFLRGMPPNQPSFDACASGTGSLWPIPYRTPSLKNLEETLDAILLESWRASKSVPSLSSVRNGTSSVGIYEGQRFPSPFLDDKAYSRKSGPYGSNPVLLKA